MRRSHLPPTNPNARGKLNAPPAFAAHRRGATHNQKRESAMATQAQLDAAVKAARAWIDQEAGFYASMIPDADVQALCQVVIDAASQSTPATQTKEIET
jgi:hypothetical protein